MYPEYLGHSNKYKAGGRRMQGGNLMITRNEQRATDNDPCDR
jgi:hypothetical protein